MTDPTPAELIDDDRSLFGENLLEEDMTDTKIEAPERIWARLRKLDKPYKGINYGLTVDHSAFEGGYEYVRADLFADMTRQRDEARAAGFAAGLEAAMKEISDLASPADIPGGCLIPDTFDEGTSAAFDAVEGLLRALAEGAKP